MSSFLAAIHAGLAWLFSLVWGPLARLSPSSQLIVVSSVFGIVMVVLYGRVSNQAAIRRVKQQIGAALLEVVLFRRDVKVSLTAQMSLLWAGCKYFLLALGPVLILALPFAFVLGHINLRLGARPLAIGESGLVAVSVEKGVPLQNVELKGSDGLEVVGPVRVPRNNSVFWRVTPTKDGSLPVDIRVTPNTKLHEQVVAGVEAATPTAGIFLSRSDWLSQILFPNGGASQVLPPSPIQSIEVTYPQRDYVLFGFQMSWLTAFLVVSILAGYAGSRLFGISV